MKSEDRQHLVKELMRRTGKGQIACDISLTLAHNDIDKAVERMRIAYPSMEVKS